MCQTHPIPSIPPALVPKQVVPDLPPGQWTTGGPQPQAFYLPTYLPTFYHLPTPPYVGISFPAIEAFYFCLFICVFIFHFVSGIYSVRLNYSVFLKSILAAWLVHKLFLGVVVFSGLFSGGMQLAFGVRHVFPIVLLWSRHGQAALPV